jgi:hypothetical protein
VGYDWHRILSALVALCLIGLAVLSGDPGAIIVMLLYLVWPIAMIWWPELLGSMNSRFIGHGWLSQRSAAWLVRSFGWVLLVGIILVVVWYVPYLDSLPS